MIISPGTSESTGADTLTVQETISTDSGVELPEHQNEACSANESASAESTHEESDKNENPIDILTDPEEITSLYPDLQSLPPDKFRFADIFKKNRTGRYRNSNNKFKVKLLKAVGRILTENLLLNNEYVLNIARGSAYYPAEIPYANGLLTLPTNYYAIVCTNFRLLFINVDCRVKKPTRYLYQIFYEEIVRLSRGMFFTSLIVQTRNGNSWNFTTVRTSLSREIRDLIIKRKKEGASGIFDGISRWHLCPACYTAITGQPSSCPGCKSLFKDPAQAWKRSILLPGLGSIYLGYRSLAITEILLYIAFWFLLISLAYLKLPGIVPISVFLIAVLHGTAGFMSLKLAQKGLIVHSATGSG